MQTFKKTLKNAKLNDSTRWGCASLGPNAAQELKEGIWNGNPQVC